MRGMKEIRPLDHAWETAEKAREIEKENLGNDISQLPMLIHEMTTTANQQNLGSYLFWQDSTTAGDIKSLPKSWVQCYDLR